jgi:hypothetical protein
MGARDYLVGLAWISLVIGPVALGARLVLRRRLAHLGGEQAALAFTVLTTAALVLAWLVPGVLHLLHPAAAALVALALLAGAAATRREEPGRAELRAGGGGARRDWAAALAAAACVSVYVVAFLLARGTQPITAFDTLTFELPTIADWMRTSSLWHFGQYLPIHSFGAYPQSGQLVAVMLIAPFRSDAFARFAEYPYVAACGLGVYALARELGALKAHAVAWSAAAVATPALLLPSIDWAKPDAIMLAAFLGGATFLVRHWRTGARSDLLLAAVGFGVAFGAKWYGVICVSALLGAWLVVRAVTLRSPRAAAREAMPLVGIVGALGGFWLVRNWIATGDPLFPVRVSALGVTIFDAPPDLNRAAVGFKLTDYATDPDVIRHYVVPAFRHSFAATGALAALALVASVLSARRLPDVRIAAIGAAGLLLAAVYAATPYTAQGPAGRPVLVVANVRYAMPAILLGAAAGAALTTRMRRWSTALLALLVVATLDALTRIDDVGPIPYLHDVAGGGRLPVAFASVALLAGAALLARRSSCGAGRGRARRRDRARRRGLRPPGASRGRQVRGRRPGVCLDGRPRPGRLVPDRHRGRARERARGAHAAADGPAAGQCGRLRRERAPWLRLRAA